MSRERCEPMVQEKAPLEFVAVGHVTHDRVDGRIRLGGAALYSCVTATRLGKHAGIVTSFGQDYRGKEILDGIPMHVARGSKTSTFENLYLNRERVQHIYGIAEELRPEMVPSAWRNATIVYICPVLHEVSMELPSLFQGSIVGLAPQGLFRAWDGHGRIYPSRWEGFEDVLPHVNMVIVSESDIAGNEDIVDLFRDVVDIVVVTRAEKGAVVYARRRVFDLGVYPANECEPTGAGDCFGASFLIRYQETGDIEEAARFASCVGSFVVEKDGIEGIPQREEVVARMKSHRLPVTARRQIP